MLLLLYLGLGILIGFMSGLFGMGGGIIAVPTLFMIFEYFQFSYDISLHLAIGTSLACMTISTLGTAVVHHQHKAVQWQVCRFAIPGILMGSPVGAWGAQYLTTDTLEHCFGFFLVFVALQLLTQRHEREQCISIPRLMYTVIGFVMGLLSGALGVGGATFMVPILLFLGFKTVHASATAAACIWPMALLGTITQMGVGYENPELPQYSIGFVYWPAALGIGIASLFATKRGAYWAHRLPQRTLKSLFAIVCLLMAGKMIL